MGGGGGGGGGGWGEGDGDLDGLDGLDDLDDDLDDGLDDVLDEEAHPTMRDLYALLKEQTQRIAELESRSQDGASSSSRDFLRASKTMHAPFSASRCPIRPASATRTLGIKGGLFCICVESRNLT